VAPGLTHEGPTARIVGAAAKVGPQKLGFSAGELVNRLRLHLNTLDAAAGLVPRVLARDPTAERELRDLLGRVSLGRPGLPDRRAKGIPDIPTSPCEFPSFGQLGGLYLASAMMAQDERDWNALRAGVDGFFRVSEWGESLYSASLHGERTGDLMPFSHRARAYMYRAPDFLGQ
jgi:hypothetical protein